MTKMSRPNLSDYFRAQIDYAVNGMMSTTQARLPHDVTRVNGTVESDVITAIMRDGAEYRWSGGRYSARKRNGCYAPLMPRPVK